MIDPGDLRPERPCFAPHEQHRQPMQAVQVFTISRLFRVMAFIAGLPAGTFEARPCRPPPPNVQMQAPLCTNCARHVQVDSVTRHPTT